MRTVKMNHYKRRWDNHTRRWVYKHREMVEETLGRKLFFGEQVHHIDGNVLNNAPENLEIVYAGEHFVIHGLNKSQRKLTWSDVDIIRRLRKKGHVLKEIGSLFNIHYSTISRICSNERRVTE